MKNIKQLFYFFMIFFFASSGFAKTVLSLTLERAVDMALSNNKSLKRESLGLKKLERAKRFPYSDIFSSASLTSQLEIPYLNRKENPIALGTLLEAGMSFSPAIFKKIERIKLEYEAGNITYEKAMRIIEGNVKILFYRIIYETEYAKLSNEIYETLLGQSKQIEAKYKNGLLPESDFLNAKIECNKQRSVIFAACDAVLESSEIFKQLLGIGIDEDCEIKLVGNFPENIDAFLLETESELLNVARHQQNFDARYLEKSLDAAKANLGELKLLAFVPTLGIGFQYNPLYAFQSGGTENSGFQNNGKISIGISWNILNLLPFSECRAQIKNAKDTVESLKLEIEEARESQKIKTEGYVRKATRLIDAIRTDILNKRLAEKNYDFARAAYQKGYKDFSFLRDASDQKKNAEVSLLYDLFSLLETKINLETGN